MKNEVNIIDELRREKIIKQRRHDHSFSGKTGYCFIKGDKVIKLYEHPREYNSKFDLTKYKSNRISFPIDYLYENGKIIAEVLPYYQANTIYKSLDLRSSIDLLINSYKEIEEEIKRFPSIAMNDVCKENILYSSKKGIFLIDTTDWLIDEDEYNTEYNIKLLEKSLIALIEDWITNDNYNSIDSISLSRNLYNYISHGRSLLLLLKEYQENVRINYNYSVKNISDVKKYIKILKIS